MKLQFKSLKKINLHRKNNNLWEMKNWIQREIKWPLLKNK